MRNILIVRQEEFSLIICIKIALHQRSPWLQWKDLSPASFLSIWRRNGGWRKVGAWRRVAVSPKSARQSRSRNWITRLRRRRLRFQAWPRDSARAGRRTRPIPERSSQAIPWEADGTPGASPRSHTFFIRIARPAGMSRCLGGGEDSSLHRTLSSRTSYDDTTPCVSTPFAHSLYTTYSCSERDFIRLPQSLCLRKLTPFLSIFFFYSICFTQRLSLDRSNAYLVIIWIRFVIEFLFLISRSHLKWSPFAYLLLLIYGPALH